MDNDLPSSDTISLKFSDGTSASLHYLVFPLFSINSTTIKANISNGVLKVNLRNTFDYRRYFEKLIDRYETFDQASLTSSSAEKSDTLMDVLSEISKMASQPLDLDCTPDFPGFCDKRTTTQPPQKLEELTEKSGGRGDSVPKNQTSTDGRKSESSRRVPRRKKTQCKRQWLTFVTESPHRSRFVKMSSFVTSFTVPVDRLHCWERGWTYTRQKTRFCSCFIQLEERTVHPEYFVDPHTKFPYAGDVRTFVRMKFLYAWNFCTAMDLYVNEIQNNF